MYVDKWIKVVVEVFRNFGIDMVVVRLLKIFDVLFGYVKFVVYIFYMLVVYIRELIYWVGGGYYLLSEEFVRWFYKLNFNGVFYGLCVMERYE